MYTMIIFQESFWCSTFYVANLRKSMINYIFMYPTTKFIMRIFGSATLLQQPIKKRELLLMTLDLQKKICLFCSNLEVINNEFIACML